MARRPRAAQNDDSTENEGQGTEHGLGHNGPEPLTDDEHRALAYHHKRAYQTALAKKKEADAGFKNVAKLAKAEGVAVDEIKALIALDTDEGRAKIAEEIALRFKAARWAGVEVGETPDLFNQPDRTPLVDKARAAGKVASMNGEDPNPPHDAGGELGQAWLAGWHEGRDVMLSMLKKRETPAPIVDMAENLPEEGEGEGEGEGLSDEELDAVAPTPPTAEGIDENGDPVMPGFLKRQPEPAEA